VHLLCVGYLLVRPTIPALYESGLPMTFRHYSEIHALAHFDFAVPSPALRYQERDPQGRHLRHADIFTPAERAAGEQGRGSQLLSGVCHIIHSR
jgi:hypothetical protein